MRQKTHTYAYWSDGSPGPWLTGVEDGRFVLKDMEWNTPVQFTALFEVMAASEKAAVELAINHLQTSKYDPVEWHDLSPTSRWVKEFGIGA